MVQSHAALLCAQQAAGGRVGQGCARAGPRCARTLYEAFRLEARLPWQGDAARGCGISQGERKGRKQRA